MQQKIIVIGGGFFGLYIAAHMAGKGHHVILFEQDDDFMQRASAINQARIHQGYHYPRSVLTAARSRLSYARFVGEFHDCVDDSFQSYYLIGRYLSKISAAHFEQFCRRIGAPHERATASVTNLLNAHYIEAAYRTEEGAFDANKLREVMRARLRKYGVECHFRTRLSCVKSAEKGCLATIGLPDGKEEQIFAHHVFNTTYASLNKITINSGLSPIPLKYELTELCLVEVPDALKNCGLTVMCGPFFSVMPFPSTSLHCFSHVRYTPHRSWLEGETPAAGVEQGDPPLPSAWGAIRRDAARYVPILGDSIYRKSLWTVKTVLPRSEKDDSRPILFKPDYGIPGFHCVMGGKIDNVYDVLDAIEARAIATQQ